MGTWGSHTLSNFTFSHLLKSICSVSLLWTQICTLLTSISGLQELCFPLSKHTWSLLLQDQAALVSKSLSEITQTKVIFISRCWLAGCTLLTYNLNKHLVSQALAAERTPETPVLERCPGKLTAIFPPYLSGRNATSLNISDLFCRLTLKCPLALPWQVGCCPPSYRWPSSTKVSFKTGLNDRYLPLCLNFRELRRRAHSFARH